MREIIRRNILAILAFGLLSIGINAVIVQLNEPIEYSELLTGDLNALVIREVSTNALSDNKKQEKELSEDVLNNQLPDNSTKLNPVSYSTIYSQLKSQSRISISYSNIDTNNEQLSGVTGGSSDAGILSIAGSGRSSNSANVGGGSGSSISQNRSNNSTQNPTLFREVKDNPIAVNPGDPIANNEVMGNPLPIPTGISILLLFASLYALFKFCFIRVSKV